MKELDRKKIIKIIACALAGLMCIAAAGAYMAFSHYYNLMEFKDADSEDWTADPAGGDGGPGISSPDTDGWSSPDGTGTAASSGVSAGTATATDFIANHSGIPGSAGASGISSRLEANLAAMQESSELYEDKSFDILLIGVDNRKNENTGRSDSMIMLSVNKETRTITLASILRDIYCAIPGHGHNRLNTAFNFGGPGLLATTMKQNLGITADRYIVVNFYSVEELIDAMGGVDLELTGSEIGYMNKYIREQNRLFGNASGTDYIPRSSAGTVHLNGNQALSYARLRAIGTDFARTGRQREILGLLMDKARDMSLFEMMGYVDDFLPKITTDMTQADFASLLLMALDLSSYKLNSFSIPIDGTWHNANIAGMAVLEIDFEKNRDYWYEAVNQN